MTERLRKKNMKNLLIAIILTFIFSTPNFAQKDEAEFVSPDARVQKIDQILTKLAKDGMNGAILIRSQDKALLHKGYGLADKEKNKPMRAETGFDIGSIVKPMTGIAILKLEEQGKLSTDDTLSRFFPSAPEDKKNITLMQLMTHTAGMQDVFGGDYEVVSRDWLLEKALNAKLVRAPGKERLYSNSGYSLLAIIIEKVSGKAFEEFMREEIFKPAGVEKIGYIRAGWKNEDLAVGYLDGKRWGSPLDHQWAKDGPSWNLRGNGGMLSSVAALSRWFEALFEGKIVGERALKKYFSYAGADSKAYGGRVIGPAGGNNIFNSFQISVVEKDFHITFFTSNSEFEAERLYRDFREELVSLAQDAKSKTIQKEQ